jgi:hypothetical protein
MRMKGTGEDVAAKLRTYLRHELPLTELVDWAERAMYTGLHFALSLRLKIGFVLTDVCPNAGRRYKQRAGGISAARLLQAYR